ncbi:MAG: UDP-3-O-acyl-N-acetylglucosamine deacetylase [candidate division WOR-3 bacterium]|nr:MAG: UDP-3-O-acyl-N-acetylglucosamine deacetylase [candidate division WOR-3 bacterium]
MKRRTLRRPARLCGVSLRSFGPVSATLSPAEAGSGIVFNDRWTATTRHAGVTGHATRVGRGPGAVQMVEHLMAACAGLGITDLDVGVDGDALPFGDGSCRHFVREMLKAGARELPGSVEPLALAGPVIVESDGSFIAAVPSGRFRVKCLARFPGRGASLFAASVTRTVFLNELARARTFGTCPDGESARSVVRKLGLGFRLRSESGWLLPARLRYPDEPCRHKVVDLLGDLALLGRPLRAELFAFQPGHRLNHRFVEQLKREMEAR